jgi:hypothetical protein
MGGSLNKFWKHWARALGEKVGEDNKSADQVAIWRTLIILQAIITNLFIVINILKSWLK